MELLAYLSRFYNSFFVLEMTLIFKPKHSLLGKSLLLVIIEVKATQGGTDTFARLKKDHPLEQYSLEELRSEFHKLTGETMQSICGILGQDETLDLVRRDMHFAICMQTILERLRGSHCRNKLHQL